MNIKKIGIGVAALFGLWLVAFVVLGQMSQGGVAPGLVEGQLAACPSSPNCASSDTKSTAHESAPSRYTLRGERPAATATSGTG